MYKLRVVNDRGDSVILTNNPNYNVFKIDGLNPPKVNVNSSVNTTSDGSKINSVRANNRNIVINMTIEGDIESNRIALYKYFPLKKYITLYFENATRSVFIEGVVEEILIDPFTIKETAQISIICPKSFFQAVETTVEEFSDISSLFYFPFSIAKEGIEISAITPNIRKSIINEGDIETGVIIDLFANGTVVNPILYDVFKQSHMGFNFTMQVSDTIRINTNIGEKSIQLIRNGVSTNALGYLTPDSDWFVLESGDNLYTYGADSGTGSLQITFTTSLLYGGV